MAFSFEIPKLMDVCSKFTCSSEVQSLAAEELSPSEFISLLQEEKKSMEAVQTLSRTMPKEKAVEWAGQSAKIGGESAGLSEQEAAALKAAAEWADNPCVETQKSALEAAKGLPQTSPSYWTAQAAGHSDATAQLAGVNAALEAGQDVQGIDIEKIAGAGEDTTAQFSSGAVLLAANQVLQGGQVEVPEMVCPTFELPEFESPELDLDYAQDVLDAVEMPEVPEELSGLADMEVPEVPEVAEMTPEQIEEIANVLEPFIENGIEIAKTVPGWS